MVDGVIAVLCGAFCSAYGFRVIGPRSGANPSLDPKHIKTENLFRIIGPLLLLIGLILTADRLTAVR